MCLFPKIIKNRKYTKTKKNGGVIPAIKDKRVQYVPVGCGKCMECRKQRARQWNVRLHEEIKTNKNGKFITLTFTDESLEKIAKTITGLSGYNLENEIATKATRWFLERWRKKYKKSVRHWFVTELGQTNTERIHIHGLLFTNETEETIQKLWQYGRIGIGEYVNEKTINYITKYVTKQDGKHKEYESKILTSAGIGKNYIKSAQAQKNKYKENGTKETYTTNQGIQLNLPIYYRNQIYTEEEREKLWLEKLDEQIRWVDGRKSDISNNENHYYELLKEARRKNQELGYGTNHINWERKRYENERRNINKLKQINKKKG